MSGLIKYGTAPRLEVSQTDVNVTLRKYSHVDRFQSCNYGSCSVIVNGKLSMNIRFKLIWDIQSGLASSDGYQSRFSKLAAIYRLHAMAYLFTRI